MPFTQIFLYPQKIAQKLIALFEIISGLIGILMIIRTLVKIYPLATMFNLWFGLFPLLSIVAGGLFWFNKRFAFEVSILVLILQIPFIYLNGYSVMQLGIAFNLYVTATWKGETPNTPTVIGINILALILLFLLLWTGNLRKSSLEENSLQKGIFHL